MSWVLLDDDFQNNPKVLKAGRAAAYTFVCGLCYCRKYHTGGHIPMEAFSRIGATEAMIRALLGVGLWSRNEGGMTVHGYDGLYADEDEKAFREAAVKQRREAGRKGGVESGKTRVPKTHVASHGASSEEGMVWSGDLDPLLKEKKREADFAAFWANYPKKDGKQAARALWLKLDPDDETQRIMAADIDRRSRSSAWLKDEGQFIPHARTYLHQKRWEDGFEEKPRISERTLNVLKGFQQPKTGIA